MTAFLAPALRNGRAYLAPTAPPAAGPEVTSVTISPTAATVANGASQQFTAAALGTGSPSQAMTWTRNPASGSVSGSGLYTAVATDAQQTVIVTATSVQDPTKSASAVVTVPAAVGPDPDPGAPEPAPPAGRDYDWLVAAIMSWSHRKDLAPQIPDLIMMAEERMSADLEARAKEVVTTLTATAGVSDLTLSAGVIEVRSVTAANHPPLGYLSADAFHVRYGDGHPGPPCHYTIIGDTLRIGPKPDATYKLKLDARRTLPPLSADAPINWLIARNPSLYLAAAMTEAMDFVVDPDRRAQWEAKYQIALKSANSTSDTAGQLVVRSDARTP